MSLAELQQRYGVVIVISQCEVTTQCLACNNAYGGCQWSRDFIPIPGWDAIRNDLVDTAPYHREIESYTVLDCPEFELDPRFSSEYQKYSPENVRRAVLARKQRRGQQHADME